MCLLTELFFSQTVPLQASHLSLPDWFNQWLNWFNLSQALAFGLAVPQTFCFSSAGFVCTLHFLKTAAFSGVLNLAPASVVILKGSAGPSQWTLKRLERYLVVPGFTTEWSRHGGSHVGQKHACGKVVLNLYFSLTNNSDKYAVLPTFSSTYYG